HPRQRCADHPRSRLSAAAHRPGPRRRAQHEVARRGGGRMIRWLLGVAGVLLALFGVFRLLTQIPAGNLLALVVWLVAALVLHDGVLAPLTGGIGVVI